jgi:hypothetical protein
MQAIPVHGERYVGTFYLFRRCLCRKRRVFGVSSAAARSKGSCQMRLRSEART